MSELKAVFEAAFFVPQNYDARKCRSSCRNKASLIGFKLTRAHPERERFSSVVKVDEIYIGGRDRRYVLSRLKEKIVNKAREMVLFNNLFR